MKLVECSMFAIRRALAYTALVLMMVCCVGRASAQQTIHVPADQPTIQDGIDAAQNGDTVLVAPGTYNENIDFKGKGITVTSGATSYAGATATIVNGVVSGPVVKLTTNEPAGAVLNGFTIQGGFAYNNLTDIDAALAIVGSSPTISNNIIQNNMGCGLLVSQGASPTISGNDVRRNFPPENSSPYAFVCSRTVGVSPGTAIGIVQAGSVTITGNLIEQNTVYNSDGSSPGGTVVNGSGIYLAYTIKTVLANNTVRNDEGEGQDGLQAPEGGDNDEIVMIQNLFYTDQNALPHADAAIEVGGSDGGTATTLIEVNNTIGGEELAASYANGSVVENNIFYGSSTTGYSSLGCADVSSNLLISHNDVVGATPIPREVCSLDSTNLDTDPQFINPATDNFHTHRTSPVVAAGDINAPMIPPEDLDSRNRTVCGTIDMGVYEVHPQPATVVTSSNNPSVGGTAVTFTANVPGNCNVPTGTVTFYDGSTVLGTETLSSGATASITTSSLTVGSHNITVAYSGDFNFDRSTSATLVQVVTGYPTATTLTVSPNPVNAFGPITLGSTVTSNFGQPGGAVTFSAGGTVLATATLNASGQATAIISSLGAGTYSIVATYSATTTYATSSSVAVVETVVGAESVTALSANPNPAVAGQTVSFFANVRAAQGNAVPTGTVLFSNGNTPLGSTALNASESAGLGTSFEPGVYTITASYSGDTNFNPSSASITETVTAIATTTSLTASPNPAGYGQLVTLTATVTPSIPGVTTPGSVTFLDGGTAIGTAALNGAGLATVTTSGLAVGTHALTASYGGTGSLGGSTSAPVAETIIASAFTLSLTPSTVTLGAGQAGTVSVQLGSVGAYAGTLLLSSGALPAYVTGSFSSPSVTLQANGNATTSFALSTQVESAAREQPAGLRSSGVLAGSFAALMLAPLGLRRRRGRFVSMLLLGCAATLLLSASGCTNIGYAIHTVNPGTYTIPVTATDANHNVKTSSFTLVITP